MKALIAILSCQRDLNAGIHRQIRTGWGLDCCHDIRFFVGGDRPKNLDRDEIWLNTNDDYAHLSTKLQQILRWGINQDYDYIVKLDTDSVLREPRKVDWYAKQRADYVGYFGAPVGGTHHQDVNGLETALFNYASSNYLLSRKAAELILEYPPGGWAEDMFVGQILGARIQSGRIVAIEDADMFQHLGERNSHCRMCLTPTTKDVILCPAHESLK